MNLSKYWGILDSRIDDYTIRCREYIESKLSNLEIKFKEPFKVYFNNRTKEAMIDSIVKHKGLLQMKDVNGEFHYIELEHWHYLIHKIDNNQ
jgi:hypothetical protein